MARKWKGLAARKAGRRAVLSMGLALLCCFAVGFTGPIKAAWGSRFVHPAADQIERLDPGKTIERELSGGQAHSYQIELQAGQFLTLVCEQRGIDVILTLWGGNEAKLFEVDSPNGAQGPESITYVAENAGAFRLEVRSDLKDSGPGRYELKIVELRAATSRDRLSAAAHKLVTEAQSLQAERRAEASRQALVKFEEALRLWREAGERVEEANSLNSLGSIHNSLSQHEQSLSYYRQSLALRRELGDQPGQAQSLNNIAAVYDATGEKRKAIEHYEQALGIWRAAGDRPGVAIALSNLGWAYAAIGEPAKALDYMTQALQLRRELIDREGETATLNNLGAFYYGQGELAKAAECFEQVLPLVRSIRDPRGEAYTLTNLGLTYDALGEKQKALENHLRALEKLRAIGDRDGESATLNNLGLFYLFLEDFDQALFYYNEALPIARQLRSRDGEATLLNALGVVAVRRGDLRQALEHLSRALTLRRELSDPDGEAHVEYNIGAAHERAGDRARAVESYSRALEIWRKVGSQMGESRALSALGTTFREAGEREKAAERQMRALAIRQKLGDRSGEAMARRELALLAQDRGDLTEARAQIEAALSIVETIRAKLAGQDLRSSYFASVRDYYDVYLDLLTELHNRDRRAGFDALALQASERARARSLIETLREAGAELRQGVAPALVERERVLRRQINLKADRRLRLLGRPHRPEESAALDRELEALSAEERQIQAQILAASPRYAALSQPPTLKPAEIQQLLDSETVLLEYALGEKRSYLWIVTLQKVELFELPPRAVIESSARKVYQALTARADNPALENEQERRLRIARADADLPAELSNLSRMLLEPGQRLLKESGARRWLIVADGVLQFIPFSVLPDCSSGQRGCDPPHSSTRVEPLMASREIINLPSASTLAALRREQSNRQPQVGTVAILADPVFEATDLRVPRQPYDRRLATAAEPGPGRLKSPARMTRAAPWEEFFDAQPIRRLSFSGREAAVISSLVAEKERRILTGFDATVANAVDPALGQYRIVHLATHGFLNSRQPELSGVLFSMIDRQGLPQETAFLRLGEIYQLKLPVELVVLSACQTAIGKNIKGEGVIGLTRGFMYAGARRVVASLWRVDDEGTAELMKRFYGGMLGAQSLRPAEALRRAQLELRRSKEWSAPFYWAGFTVQGEWR